VVAIKKFNSTSNRIHEFDPPLKRKILITGIIITVSAIAMTILYAAFPEVLSPDLTEASRMDFLIASALTAGIAGPLTILFGVMAWKKEPLSLNF
jgi:hypothetical protein